MYTLHTRCRICQSKELIPVLDLGVQPLANDFRHEHEPRAGMAPLELMLCPHCLLGQLSVVVHPSVLYTNYLYSSSRTETMREHWNQLIGLIKKYSEMKRVVEIGSNDGAFLAHIKELNPNAQVMGIDPAIQFCEEAIKIGVPTIRKMWGVGTAHKALSKIKPDVVVARHVFAHIDDWNEAMEGLDVLCGKETVVVIEVPDASHMLDRIQFDQIYHEHLSYVTPHSIMNLINNSPFQLMKIFTAQIHGGSAIYLLKKGKVETVMMPRDMSPGPGRWMGFAQGARQNIERFSQTMNDHGVNGEPIVGYGAPAKSTVWIQAANLDKRQLRCLVDGNPLKAGTFSPGTDIPIFKESGFADMGVNKAVLFAWNYESEIKRKQADWIENGGEFIIP